MNKFHIVHCYTNVVDPAINILFNQRSPEYIAQIFYDDIYLKWNRLTFSNIPERIVISYFMQVLLYAID